MTAEIINPNYFGSTSGSLLVEKATSSTIVTGGTFQFDGTPKSATAVAIGPGTVDQSDLTITYESNTAGTYGPTQTAPTLPGVYAATAVYTGDGNHFGSSGSAILTIEAIQTTISLVASPNPVQYSDPFILTATISPSAIGGIEQAGTITFKLDGLTIGTASVTNGAASYTFTSTPPALKILTPGSYTMQASFDSDRSYFKGCSTSASLSVSQEDAIAVYTGERFAFTASTMDMQKLMVLKAQIKDISVVNGDSRYDPYKGDLRNAIVYFDILASGTTSVIKTVTASAYSYNGDNTIGEATATTTLSAGNPSIQYDVRVRVEGFYTGSNDQEGPAIVNISLPLQNMATGGGKIELPGTNIGGTTDSSLNFGFTFKYTQKLTNPQGKVTMIFEGDDGKIYQVKSTAINTFGVTKASKSTAGTAIFDSKASVSDISNPLTPIPVSGTFRIVLNMTDLGEPGRDDSIKFTVYDGSGIWFQSGSSVVKLSSGNLAVH